MSPRDSIDHRTDTIFITKISIVSVSSGANRTELMKPEHHDRRR
jgi:hypothetical protein